MNATLKKKSPVPDLSAVCGLRADKLSKHKGFRNISLDTQVFFRHKSLLTVAIIAAVLKRGHETNISGFMNGQKPVHF